MNEKLEKNENKKTADVLRAENLVRDYVQYGEDGEKKKEIHVLKGLNFSIQRQEFVGIMGRSGCGKTTLLKILGLIESVTDGTLLYKKNEISKLSDKELARIRREELGFVFQEFYLMDSLDVFENIMLPLNCRKISVREKKQLVNYYMKRLGIEGLSKKKPTQISGGQQQRVAIARALVTKPDIILADEPTGNLDSKTSDEVMHEINAEGKTIVVVTHDMEVAKAAKKQFYIEDGDGRIKE